MLRQQHANSALSIVLVELGPRLRIPHFARRDEYFDLAHTLGSVRGLHPSIILQSVEPDLLLAGAWTLISENSPRIFSKRSGGITKIEYSPKTVVPMATANGCSP